MFSELRQIDKRFKEVADRVGGIPAQAVPYSFRHSSIVRMLLRNVPVSVVASHHDTSAEIIQKHYARFISNVSDSITRDNLAGFRSTGKRQGGSDRPQALIAALLPPITGRFLCDQDSAQGVHLARSLARLSKIEIAGTRDAVPPTEFLDRIAIEFGLIEFRHILNPPV
jgi:hypothetical protein